MIVFSQNEYNNVVPQDKNSSSLSPTKTSQYFPTTESNTTEKILVTVINNFSEPQEVYCEGIFIFRIEPGESKSFRFQRGKWRIDLCYPGTYPCNNYEYVDMNYSTLTYTIK